MKADSELTDAELIAAFERAELPHEAWNHRAHVRVAYLYACQYGLETATARMQAGLRALNAVHRVPDAIDRGYHETVTVAYMRLIWAACRRQQSQTSADFCRANPQLLTSEALLAYYSRDRLRSLDAKTRFVEPDLCALPACHAERA